MTYSLKKFVYIGILLFFFIKTPGVWAVAPDNYRWIEYGQGITGLNIAGMVINSNAPSTLYVLTYGSGVYKSTDSGSSWTAKNTGFPTNKSVSYSHLFGNLLTIDPNNPNVLYTNMGGKPYKTTDGGDNWTEINSGIEICAPNYQITGVIVDPQNSNHLFAAHIASGCSGGVYESTDAGANWTRLTNSGIGNDEWQIAIDPTNSQRLYSGTIYNGFYYSTNGGNNWTSSPPSGSSGENYALAVHPSTTSRILLGNTNGLFLSSNSGQSWTDLTSQASGQIQDIKFAPSNSNIGYAVGADGLFKTDNGGLTWSAVGSHGSKSLKGLVIHPTDPNTLYFGSAGNGVYKTTDAGVNLTAINTGLPTSLNIRAMTVAPSDSNTYYAVVNNVGFYRSTNRGTTWVKVSEQTDVYNSFFIAVDPSDKNTIFAGYTKVYKSTDGGATWSVVLTPSSGLFRGAAIDPTNHLIIYVGQGSSPFRLYKSSDGGTNWNIKTTFGSGNERIRIDPADSSRVYAATYDYLWKSTDYGENWTRVTTGLSGANNNWLDDIAIDPNNSNILYTVTRGAKVFKSTNYGDSWSETAFSSSNAPNRIFIDQDDSNKIYAFTNFSWHSSTDASAIWSTLSTTGLTADAYLPFKFVAFQDPQDANRIIGLEYLKAPMVYENYIPLFGQSTFSVTNNNGSSLYHRNDILNFTFTLSNSGWALGTNPSVRIVLPSSGVTYSANSTRVDGLAPASDPIDSTGKILIVSTTDLVYNDTQDITFQVTINNDASGQIVVDPTVTSDEDVGGTTIANLNIHITVPGESITGGTDPDCNQPSGFAYRISAGPHYCGPDRFLADEMNAPGALLFISKDTHHDDLYLTLRKEDYRQLFNPVPPSPALPLPWSQGLNSVAEIYRFLALSSFNGYPVKTLDRPAIIVLPYDPAKVPADDESNLKLATYHEEAGRWQVIDSTVVVDFQKHQLAATSRNISAYFTIVTGLPTGEEGLDEPGAVSSTAVGVPDRPEPKSGTGIRETVPPEPKASFSPLDLLLERLVRTGETAFQWISAFFSLR